MAYSKLGQCGLVMFALSCFGCDAVGDEGDADRAKQGLGEGEGEDGGIGILVPVAIPDAGRDPGLNTKLPTKTDAGVVPGDAGQVEGDAGIVQGDAGQGEHVVIKVNVLDTENTVGLPDCNAVYFRDVDGDGFGDAKAKVTSCTKPAGYVEIDGDCYDYNERAYPNAKGQFLQSRGDGSFDYDCDGVETKLHTELAVCPELACVGLACDAAALQDATELGENGGWTAAGSVPACGQQGSWGLSVTWYPGIAKATCSAPNEGSVRTQTCR